MNTDILAGALIQLATLTAAVWGASQAFSTLHPRVNGLRVALISGPVFAAFAYWLGWFPMVATVVPDGGVRAYLSAAFAGLVATLCAKWANDYLYNPARDLLSRMKNGGGGG